MRAATRLALSAGVPLVAYLCTVSGGSYWLDAGEFVAASAMLDIAHPPGHPLAVLWGGLWTLLPLGPLAFRVALGQAVAAAAAAHFLFLALRRAAQLLPGVGETTADTVALVGTWAPALSFPLWFQAVRPEVYALHGAILLAAANQLTRLSPDGRGDPRPLYAAALCVGLALTNHHFTAFLFMPALLLAAAVVARRRGLRPIWTCAGCGLLAMGVYSYLPARASARPPVNLGDPDTLERIYWVVSAQVYTREMGTENPQPITERLADVLVALVEAVHPLIVLLALVGAYAGLRLAKTRRITGIWLLVALVAFYFRAWVGPVRGNPDALGYLFAAIAAVGALAALALAFIASAARSYPNAQRAWAIACGALALLVVIVQVRAVGPRANLAALHAVDAFDDARLARLPPGAVLIATSPTTTFRQWEDAATARVRPDVTLLALPFLRYPGAATRLSDAHPEINPIIDDYLRTDRLGAHALAQVSARRPVFLELDVQVQPALYRALRPEGLLYRVLAPERTMAIAAPGTPAHTPRAQSAVLRLQHHLGAAALEIETSRQLLWLYYTRALYLAQSVGPRAARDELAHALALHPSDEGLRHFDTSLRDAPDGRPFDVRPYLRF